MFKVILNVVFWLGNIFSTMQGRTAYYSLGAGKGQVQPVGFNPKLLVVFFGIVFVVLFNKVLVREILTYREGGVPH